MYLSGKLSAINTIEHCFGSPVTERIPPGTLQPHQKHSSQVIEVYADDMTGEVVGDAVFTKSSRPVSIITADCLPILVSAVSEPFVAAIHAGWKGLAAGIIKNAFEAFSRAGIDKSSLRVALGPGIRECCYEVSLQMTGDLESTHGAMWPVDQPPWSFSRPAHQVNSAKATHGEAWLSLSKYCTYLLMAEGVEPGQIEDSAICTYCSDLGFGSYRRRQHRSEPKAFQCSWIRSLL